MSSRHIKEPTLRNQSLKKRKQIFLMVCGAINRHTEGEVLAREFLDIIPIIPKLELTVIGFREDSR
jgi:DNA-binding transcriptional regulator YdaS (Cro superfamily)